ncbi:uncharacterized protein LOC128921930 [Zeugodacus cucurbitae]|uniref:uncharacterized protein LOC128921930 n=1 Tax=Zeugodacus cucurbitae TaxID=28588 RepID=UPI0023D8E7CF|nr:uncharacterized protein LOC128921930 [Zeugodacus cucurbitae]
MARGVKMICALVTIFAILLLTQNFGGSETKSALNNNRKSGSGRTPSSAGNVTKPSYPTKSGSSAGNSHTDVPKLRCPGYNSQPNRPDLAPGGCATNTQHIGWNVPKSQGPPAPATNVYSSPAHMPGGYSPSAVVPPSAALPQGSVPNPQPPQQTSTKSGFDTGSVTGAIGEAILERVLRPIHTRVVSAQPAAAKPSGSNDGKIIIINNGPPGSVTTTNANRGTVITTGVVGENVTKPMPGQLPAVAPAGPAVSNVPLAPVGKNIAAQPTPAPGAAPAEDAAAAAPQPAPEQPVRINETDPNDNTKMVEVEKTAGYLAPQPPPPASAAGAEMNGTAPVMPPAGKGSAPLAPIGPVTAASQQLQAIPTQIPLLSDNTSAKKSGAVAWLNSIATVLLPLFVAFFGNALSA